MQANRLTYRTVWIHDLVPNSVTFFIQGHFFVNGMGIPLRLGSVNSEAFSYAGCYKSDKTPKPSNQSRN